MNKESQEWGALLEGLDDKEVPWNPENTGEQIYGVLQEIAYPRLKHGVVARLYIRDHSEPTIHVVTAGRAALKSECERRRIQPGDQIAIRYLGKQKSKGGADFHAYRVQNQGGPRNPDQIFKVVEDHSGEDLGLTTEAEQASSDDVWKSDEPMF